jgi:uncharacterized protein (DUF433 family)
MDMTQKNGPLAIIRTERGLTIKGTRITLYDVMEYLKADYPTWLIQDRLSLTEEQLTTALIYIQEHQTEVDAEYQAVLETSQEIRTYWEQHNQERFQQASQRSAKPEEKILREKLDAWKTQLEVSE